MVHHSSIYPMIHYFARSPEAQLDHVASYRPHGVSPVQWDSMVDETVWGASFIMAINAE